jgi:quercetin dioxygenase-like cupin family protein
MSRASPPSPKSANLSTPVSNKPPEETELPQIEEREGGDAACWAHLISEESLPGPVSLAAILGATDGHGPIWSRRSTDLDLNVIALTPDHGIERHINPSRDVLLVAIEGTGTITIDDGQHRIAAGEVIVIPKGTARSIAAVSERFAYLSCHLHRPPLMPTVGPR